MTEEAPVEKTKPVPEAKNATLTENKKPSNIILYSLIGVIGVLMISLTAVGTALLTKNNNADQKVAKTTTHKTDIKKEVKKEEVKEQVKEEAKEEAKEEDASKEEAAMPEFYQIRPSIIVTLPASGKTRYISLDIDLMTNTKSSLEKINAYAPLIKSNLVELLGKQVFDEIITEEGKKKLRTQALTLLQTIMTEQAGEPIIEQVLFTSFIVQ